MLIISPCLKEDSGEGHKENAQCSHGQKMSFGVKPTLAVSTD
jgi:hypothetical protein